MFNKIALSTAFVASTQAKKLHMRDGDGSIPACTSYECKKDTATAGWDVPEEFTFGYSYGAGPDYVVPTSLHQRRSVPACNSTGCKTDSASSGWNVPSMSPEVYGNNGEYSYASNDHNLNSASP